jgi:hypothetical protein
MLHLMSAADFVQRNERAVSFQLAKQRLMYCSSRRTLSKLPHRIACA